MVNVDDLIIQLPKHLRANNAGVVVDNALDGADYIATFTRALPQFFFGVLLVFPGVQAAAIVLAAGLFARYAYQAQQKALLSDAFILSYYAVKKSIDNEDNEDNEFLRIGSIIDAMKKDKAHSARIASLEIFAADNKANIITILKEQTSLIDDTQHNTYKPIWDQAFSTVMHFGVTHWIVWMVGTLIAYTDPFNGNFGREMSYGSDATSPPALLDGNAVIIQFGLPALVALAALIYNLARKNDQAAQAAFALKQDQVRRLYLSQEEGQSAETSDGNEGSQSSVAEPLITKNNQGNLQEKTAIKLTMATTFFDAFLVLNVFAVPLTLLIEMWQEESLNEDFKIPMQFSLIVVLSVAHMMMKKWSMERESKEIFGAENRKQITYSGTSQSFSEYYSGNKKTAAYWLISRATGSGGILATRILFDGGIGGYIAKEAGWLTESNSMDHQTLMLPIAAVAAVAMVTLNLWQAYHAAQRQEALRIKKDEILRSPASSQP